MIRYQIQIVTWNSEQSISHLLDDIRAQTIRPHRIIVVDNGSRDATVGLLKSYPEVTLIQLEKNTGFTHAHNLAFSKNTDCDYIFCLNPDVRISPQTAEKLLISVEENQKIGSISPLLLRPRLTEEAEGNKIDCAGISRTITFHFINTFENKKYIPAKFNSYSEMFANTGACVLFRKSALSSVTYRHAEIDEVFDENFFAYQEDADLGWRLQKHGWLNVVQNNCIAYHERSIRSSKSFSDRTSKIIQLSHQNHLLTLLKNLTLVEGISFGIFILVYELSKAAYLGVRFPRALGTSIKNLITLARPTLKKRNYTTT